MNENKGTGKLVGLLGITAAMGGLDFLLGNLPVALDPVFPWAGPEGTVDPALTDAELHRMDKQYYDGLVAGMGEEWTKKVTKTVVNGQVVFNSPDGGTFKFTRPAQPWSTDQPDPGIEVQPKMNRTQRRAQKYGAPRGGTKGRVTRAGTKNNNRKPVGG